MLIENTVVCVLVASVVKEKVRQNFNSNRMFTITEFVLVYQVWCEGHGQDFMGVLSGQVPGPTVSWEWTDYTHQTRPQVSESMANPSILFFNLTQYLSKD